MIVTEIQDYLIDTLKAVTDLADITTWERGYILGERSTPQDQYPLGEVVIVPKINEGRLTGNYFEDRYEGIIAFTTIKTETANTDWSIVTGVEAAELTTYLQVRAWVNAAINELRKCDHRDLGEMVDDNKAVVDFDLGTATFGAGQDQRQNNWKNNGVIPFMVRTQEVYG